MKHIMLVVLFSAVMLTGVIAAQDVYLGADPTADKNQPQDRSVTGTVLGKSDAPVQEAIVYLKNTKTLTIKSFITEKDGGYRFHGLSPNVDYEIYAEHDGQKSATKTISSFDTRSNITLNLHVDTK